MNAFSNSIHAHLFSSTAIKCEAPKIENGIVHGNIREYNEHDVLHFDCIDKYKRTEERPSKCIKIGMRAEWSPTPMCECKH